MTGFFSLREPLDAFILEAQLICSGLDRRVGRVIATAKDRGRDVTEVLMGEVEGEDVAKPLPPGGGLRSLGVMITF